MVALNKCWILLLTYAKCLVPSKYSTKEFKKLRKDEERNTNYTEFCF